MKDAQKEALRLKKKRESQRRLAKAYYYKTLFEMKIVSFIGKKIGYEDMTCNLMMPICDAVEATSNCFVNYIAYPADEKEFEFGEVYSSEDVDSKVAIVMQGPILTKGDFTLNTVKFYKRVFKGATIIVSTWKNTPEDIVLELEKEGALVVLNESPEKPGFGNINYQSISSLGGVKKAKELGLEYVLKTRCDMRITATETLDVLTFMVKNYPIDDEFNDRQSARIVLFNPYLFKPYQCSDYYFFGKTEDMEAWFDKELNTLDNIDNIHNTIIAEEWTYRKSFEHMGGENEMPIMYYKKLRGEVSCNLKEWWNLLGSTAIVMPISFMRTIWPKYDFNHEENKMSFRYIRKIFGGQSKKDTVITFGMWNDMRLKRFSLDEKDYEYLMDEV